MNKKGFTLIELLAVILILGVVMFIAVPSISRYVLGSRGESYLQDAKRFINSARSLVESDMPFNKTDITYYIPIKCLSVDKAEESPFGKWKKAYVVVTYDNSKHDYYFTSVDEQNMGIYLTYSENLSTDRLESGVNDISTSIGVGKNSSGQCKRSKIRILDESSCNINGSLLIQSVTTCIDDKQSYSN